MTYARSIFQIWSNQKPEDTSSIYMDEDQNNMFGKDCSDLLAFVFYNIYWNLIKRSCMREWQLHDGSSIKNVGKI